MAFLKQQQQFYLQHLFRWTVSETFCYLSQAGPENVHSDEKVSEKSMRNFLQEKENTELQMAKPTEKDAPNWDSQDCNWC